MSMTVGISVRPVSGHASNSGNSVMEPCVMVTLPFCIGNGVNQGSTAQATMSAREARAYAKMLENAADAIEVTPRSPV